MHNVSHYSTDAVSDDESQELKAGGTYSVKAFFTNPLKKPLTNVVFHIEGTRLTKPLKLPGQYVIIMHILEDSLCMQSAHHYITDTYSVHVIYHSQGNR